MKRRKELGQGWMLAKHLDGLDRSNFCDFDKPRKRPAKKNSLSPSNKARRKVS